MTRRQLLSTATLLPPLIRFEAAAATANSSSYPGVNYRDYFRCLPDVLDELAARAYQVRNRQIASLTTPAAIRKRQEWTRETFWKLVGDAPERTPLNLRTVGSFERDHYRVEKLIYESQPGFHVSANLYIPKSYEPPFPGVLFQMGHTANGKAGPTYQRCCQGLAQLGFLVLAFDPMGQGERIYYPKDAGARGPSATDEHSHAGRPMLLVGESATRIQAWDAIRSMDVLAAHPQVDAKCIGVTGQSGGGTTSMFLSAVDDRIAAAVICSGITENFACGNFIAPGSTDDAEQDFVGSGPLGFDRWDLLYPLAPKPLLVSVSDRDFFGTYSPRYLSSGWEEFQKLRKIYSVHGQEHKIAWGGTPLPHGLSYDSRLLTYNWLTRWLKGQTTRIEVEPPTKLETDATLAVTSSGNTVKSLSSKTPYTLTLAALPKKPTPVDLKTMLQAEMPPKGVTARVLKQVPSEGCRIAAIEIPSVRNVWLPAWLFLPKTNAAARSVLLLLEPAGRNGNWQEGGLYQALAADGHIVCVPDLRGVGDLAPELGRGAAQDAQRHRGEEAWAWGSMILGKPLVGQRVTDILAVQEALRNYEGVAGRPLIVAAQGKMTVPAQLAAALDSNYSVLYLTRGLLSFRNIVETEYYDHPFANFLPGILRHTDLPELTGPKRMLLAGMVNAAGQALPAEAVRSAYSNAAHVEIVAEAGWDAATLSGLAS
jgi:cephalosporin-C deacetylase-like acetyl esterase